MPCGIGFMSKAGAIKRAVQRKRKDVIGSPNNPTTWEEVIVPDQLKVTKDNQQFLILDKVLDTVTSKKILGFASPFGLQTLRNSSQWFADGTFEIARYTIYPQVFVITAKTKLGAFVPCAYFLCPDKETKTYTALFAALKDLKCTPNTVYSDFEHAISNAVSQVYPSAIIRCCDVHFKRAVRKNIQKFHLQGLYDTDSYFQLFISHLWALALVPASDVQKVWNEIIEPIIPEEDENDLDVKNILNFIAYFERTWIGTPKYKSKDRRPPIFSHDKWSCFDAVKAGDDTTTNTCEGYNNAVALSIPHHAGVWTLVEQFRVEETMAQLKHRDAAVGGTGEQGRRRSQDKHARQEELRMLVNNYDDIAMEDYISYVVAFYQ